ncbi:hypothetical protein OEJ37_04415 [Burkholderia sp. BKH01]|uniref:hypothetical protein n=1 Tax=Burkholderia sp. BKH01 TaxID=2769262 RepID=UPI0021E03D98|nr:hypothetical protein [Burkholderia sp. BKH01]MCU9952604.1 hypothetical protein [Burkholderia sp. BKH01]
MFSSDRRQHISVRRSVAESTKLSVAPPRTVADDRFAYSGRDHRDHDPFGEPVDSTGQIRYVGNVLGTSVDLTGQQLIDRITMANTYSQHVNCAIHGHRFTS